MRKLMKKISLLTAMLVVFISVCGYAYSTNHKKVYDEAELFTESEIANIEKLAKQYGDEVQMDLVVYTINTNEHKTAREIADDFYDENKFGWEDCDGSGGLLLIDMYQREIYISFAGLGIAYIDENTENDILDVLQDDAKAGNYYEAAVHFVKLVNEAATEFRDNDDYKEVLENWYNGEYSTYDDIAAMVEPKEPTFFSYFKNPLYSFGAAGVIAIIVVLVMLYQAKTRMTVDSRTYLAQNSLRFPVRNDRFINKTTTSRTIESSSSSSGGSHSHHSSSGRSHSGGGRSF